MDHLKLVAFGCPLKKTPKKETLEEDPVENEKKDKSPTPEDSSNSEEFS